MNEEPDTTFHESVVLTSEIVAAYVSHNSVHAGDLVALIGNVHAAINALGQSVSDPSPYY